MLVVVDVEIMPLQSYSKQQHRYPFLFPLFLPTLVLFLFGVLPLSQKALPPLPSLYLTISLSSLHLVMFPDQDYAFCH